MTALDCPACKPGAHCIRHPEGGESDQHVSSVPRASVPKPTKGSVADRSTWPVLVRQESTNTIAAYRWADIPDRSAVWAFTDGVWYGAARDASYGTIYPSALAAADAIKARLPEDRTAILDIHAALDKAGAPLGGSPVERIEAMGCRADRDIEACSFCHKGKDQVSKLVHEQGSYICAECVHLCAIVVGPDPYAPPVAVVASPTLIDALNALTALAGSPGIDDLLKIVRRECGVAS